MKVQLFVAEAMPVIELVVDKVNSPVEVLIVRKVVEVALFPNSLKRNSPSVPCIVPPPDAGVPQATFPPAV